MRPSRHFVYALALAVILLSQQIVSQTQSPPQLSASPTAAKNRVNVSTDNGRHQPGILQW